MTTASTITDTRAMLNRIHQIMTHLGFRRIHCRLFVRGPILVAFTSKTATVFDKRTPKAAPCTCNLQQYLSAIAMP